MLRKTIQSIMIMTDEIVEDSIRGWATFVADKINVPNALDLALSGTLKQIVDAITAQDQHLGIAVTNFLVAYQNWWALSRRSDLSGDEQLQLVGAVNTRNASRASLIELMKDYQ